MPRAQRARRTPRSATQSSTTNAFTCPNRTPSATGSIQSTGALSSAAATQRQAPARSSSGRNATTTVRYVAATCSAVHSQPTTPNGIAASGSATTAANGG
ncbi:hypothetical protein GCM10025868_21820 [Angustibacter aerolatus]|uniref:Uncharacterized protein n=1 Tax=Angustibacter aerolatus TaxID=1162965 RepID=A0ABQ6JGN2_9ACTN|nr:hypothetical protein [Angustibacter aerolatus]GMA86932.1 hypothetical protein GCM10025868_21820 [Angustibacter aerolatus]